MKWLIYRIPFEVILYLYHHRFPKNYALRIVKEIDSTYPHIVKIIAKFENIGLITKNKKHSKRTNFLELTTKGKMIAQNLFKLNRLLK